MKILFENINLKEVDKTRESVVQKWHNKVNFITLNI